MAKIHSTEDNNLTSSILSTRTTPYKDIDLTLALNTTTGDIYAKKDAAAVKQSIKTLLLTNRFEKPFKPRFGANLQGLLFDLSAGNDGNQIVERITKAIESFEPRARVLKIRAVATPSQNTVKVRVEFQVVNTKSTEIIETSITRVR